MRFLPARKTKEEAPGALNGMLPADTTDRQILDLWIKQHDSLQTQQAYAQDMRQFLESIENRPLRMVTLADLQRYKDDLTGRGLARATIARRLSTVKSLLSFCQTTGYLAVNVGAAIKPPKAEEKLATRIMSEAQFQHMLALEGNPRNHALLRLMHNAGLRVSEVCRLTWRELGGQTRIYGKGSKERYILISAETYQEIEQLRGQAEATAPVFSSRKKAAGGQLTRGHVHKLIEAAAIRAGIALYQETSEQGQSVTRSRVSPHWIRHAHASHAIEKGAPVTLVRDTLGHASIATTNTYSHARPGTSSGTYLAV